MAADLSRYELLHCLGFYFRAKCALIGVGACTRYGDSRAALFQYFTASAAKRHAENPSLLSECCSATCVDFYILIIDLRVVFFSCAV